MVKMAETNNMVTKALPPRYPKKAGSSTKIQNPKIKRPTEMNLETGARGTEVVEWKGKTNLKLSITVAPSLVNDKSKGKGKGKRKGVATGLDPSRKTDPNVLRYRWNNETDLEINPRKKRRILANRLYAKKMRQQKLVYLSTLEQKANALQAEVTQITPVISYHKRTNLRLTAENNTMRQRIDTLTSEKLVNEDETVKLKKERDRLLELLDQQQQKELQQPIQEPVDLELRL
ncbi:basic leucine zipper 2-like [Macadamia integrifolia]|uniref:basic leucine zipper 2-like n=1 Tax=Macadamia integrifolia TaxID=60698 RepID=UPI001C52EB47|nr:basic leucine zipper 2-like [Macadamia integrifolia]